MRVLNEPIFNSVYKIRLGQGQPAVLTYLIENYSDCKMLRKIFFHVFKSVHFIGVSCVQHHVPFGRVIKSIE